MHLGSKAKNIRQNHQVQNMQIASGMGRIGSEHTQALDVKAILADLPVPFHETFWPDPIALGLFLAIKVFSYSDILNI